MTSGPFSPQPPRKGSLRLSNCDSEWSSRRLGKMIPETFTGFSTQAIV